MVFALFDYRYCDFWGFAEGTVKVVHFEFSRNQKKKRKYSQYPHYISLTNHNEISTFILNRKINSCIIYLESEHLL